MSKLLNPKPSLNWESLNLEEVYNLTGIRLKNKEWKWYFTNFHEFQDKNHTDECKKRSVWEGYKGCDCVLSSCLVAIFKAGTYGVSGVARGREFFVNVPVEKVSELHRGILTNSELRPEHIQERLYQGYKTLITLLKVYEVTGLVLDFGPPLTLYTEEGFKQRRIVREINGDELFEIIHREEKEEKCIQETSPQMLLMQ